MSLRLLALALLISSTALSGCLTTFAASDERLVETASFDNDCPEDRIEIVSKNEQGGGGQYVLNVCGTEIKYKRTGSVYHRADQSPVPAN